MNHRIQRALAVAVALILGLTPLAQAAPEESDPEGQGVSITGELSDTVGELSDTIGEPSGTAEESSGAPDTDETADKAAETDNAAGDLTTGNAVLLEAAQASQTGGAKTDTYQGKDGVVLLEENGGLTWNLALPQEGVYRLLLTYCPVEDQGMDMEIRLGLDGKTIGETGRFKINRIWQDDPAGLNGPDGRFQRDQQGNEVVPHRVESFMWSETVIRESGDGSDGGLLLTLPQGEHTLQLTQISQKMAIQSLTLLPPEEIPSYDEVYAGWKAAGAQDVPAAATVNLEAEQTYSRSNAAIYPSYDRSTPSTSPNDPAQIRLNTIGGQRWSQAGDWISWKITVPQTGLYVLSFKYRQDLVRGLSVYRRITIDGKVPFDAFKAMAFPYGVNWARLTPSDDTGEPYRVYLEAGRTYELRMEAVLGPMRETVSRMEDAILELNALYRSIVMVTGTSPDFYRDYYLDTEIPELLPRLREVRQVLADEAAKLDAMSGDGGNQAAFFHEVIRQVDDFLEDSRSIPERLSRFKGNIGSLAELMADLKSQPLELDTLSAAGVQTVFPRENASFGAQFVFRLRAFLASFQADYSAMGSVYDGAESAVPLDVWVSVNDLMQSGVASGRDQAQMLKRMIDEYFSPETGIAVNLSLVNTADALMQAIMGGKGPDAALFVPEATPVNLAMRGALTDLSQLPGFDEMRGRALDSAYIAYTYEGGVYALPETQTFQMMFYRKDIFEELGLEPPQTWDDFYTVTSRLQKKHMQVGIPESQSVFEMLLLQNGGSLYNDRLSATTLDTTEALRAFETWTDLYLQYSLPLAFDFFNRFRTGEMPLGITSYVMYSQLSVAAPELQNLWEMVPVPGVERDGEIVRAQSCSGTGCVLLADSDRQEEGWTFLEWWTRREVQRQFGNEMEAVLGTAARYTTANQEAFRLLPWSREEKEQLLASWEDVTDIPQTPASYYISRSLTNAFRKVVYSYNNPREVLGKYSVDMNLELQRKREEFGLEEGQ